MTPCYEAGRNAARPRSCLLSPLGYGSIHFGVEQCGGGSSGGWVVCTPETLMAVIAAPPDLSVKRVPLVLIHVADWDPFCARANNTGLLPSRFDAHTSASARLEFQLSVVVQVLPP